MLIVNGRGVPPLLSLVGAVALVSLGFLLLPFIGGVLLVLLLIVGGFYLYSLYWKWRHGDPMAELKKRLDEALRGAASGAASASSASGGAQSAMRAKSDVDVDAGPRTGQARVGVKRVTVVEDAVIVDEVSHKR